MERPKSKEARQDRIHIAITGASGRIGSSLIENLSEGFEITSLQHIREIPLRDGMHLLEDFDITNADSVERHVENLARNGVCVVINCTGVANVDASEKERDDYSAPTYKVNVVGTRYLAQATQDFGLSLIHISTEYVFDGRKNPGQKYRELEYRNYNSPTWYGFTKARSEDEAAYHNRKSTIVRISQVQSPKFGLFAATLRALEKGVPFTRASDQLVSPISNRTVSEAIAQIAFKLQPGHLCYHVSSTEAATSYELCRRLAEAVGQSEKAEKLISPRTLEELVAEGEQAVVRPKNAVLDTSRFEQEFGKGILGTIDEEIEKYLETK